MYISYSRVIPRDLFNEAKLLKCLGLLSLRILDRNTPCNMHFEENGDPFDIQLMQEGYLTVANLKFYIKGKPILLISQYNSKNNYPLYVYRDYCEYPVFNDDGTYAEEFLNLCK